MSEPNKCKHPACTCLVPKETPYGPYCSEHCQEAADETELRCDCMHLTCRAGAVPTRS